MTEQPKATPPKAPARRPRSGASASPTSAVQATVEVDSLATLGPRYLGYFGKLATGGALLFAVAFVMGWLNVAGRFTAYGIPPTLIDPQPIPTALNTFSIVLLAYNIFGQWRGSYVLGKSLPPVLQRHRGWTLLAVLAFFVLALYNLTQRNSWDWVVVLVATFAAYAYFGSPETAKPTPRTLLVLLLFAGVLAFGAGAASGLQTRANPSLQPRISVQTFTVLPSLFGTPTPTGAYEYADLYVIYADNTTLILGSRLGDRTIWQIPRQSVLSLTIIPK